MHPKVHAENQPKRFQQLNANQRQFHMKLCKSNAHLLLLLLLAKKPERGEIQIINSTKSHEHKHPISHKNDSLGLRLSINFYTKSICGAPQAIILRPDYSFLSRNKIFIIFYCKKQNTELGKVFKVH